MSRLSILIAATALFAVGCSDSNTTTTTPTPAAPQTKYVFTASLAASNEVPPIPAGNAEFGATGQATITMNTTKDSAGQITAATVDVVATFANFPPGSTLSLAHIHTGGSTVAGGVVVPMVPAAGEVTFPNGSGSFVKGGFPVTPVDVANQIINNPSGFYFNVHSPVNPGGVARGQLVRAQ